jgi:dipeptidyl aminopeptidase/acylaminoacyl peptidase
VIRRGTAAARRRTGAAGAVPGGDADEAQPAGPGGPAPEARLVLPYGTWPSPITASQVAAGRRKLSFPIITGTGTWWQETRPAEAGRTTVMYAPADGEPRTLLPAPWNARTRVHEYGGLSYLPVPGAHTKAGPQDPGGCPFVFANLADQRLYLAGPAVAAGAAQPVPLTPEAMGAAGIAAAPAAAPRYADFVLSPDQCELWCVREEHAGGAVTRAIVAVPLDGSAAENPAAVRDLVTGSDFLAYPTPSPDGEWLAWITWNHPNMPWDGTELRVAPVRGGVPGRSRLIKGSNRESVLAPLWRDNASLYVATDWTGWWNIYQISLTGEPPQALFPADEEFAAPLWELGARPFARLADGRLAVTHGRGDARIGLLDPETSELTDPELPFTVFKPSVCADGTAVAGVAGGPAEPMSVVRINLASSAVRVLRRELDDVPEPGYLPAPRAVELAGRYGQLVHALVYPPSHPAVTAPAGELPPFVVWVHGGPTSHAAGTLSLDKAYFTSRGIGIVDVNYGGSSGYGRRYRDRLRRQWGVVDVEDAIAAARSLADSGEADPARLAIRGSSAGGWTALAAVTTGAHEAVFSAAVSCYGVTDLRSLAHATHDFESRYLDGLIGPLPGFEAVYAERAPAGHVNKNTCPVLLLQGLDDPVVPPAQSEAIAAELASFGIPHVYITFDGESHGFRKAATIEAALEAELAFYGQVLGFEPPGVRPVQLTVGG